MDAVGTIIGAISLSITLCQGIITYCHDWKHQNEDVRSLRSLCDGLVQHLQAIDRVVKGYPTLNPCIVGNLDDALKTCTRHCEAVLSLSEKYAAGKPKALWKGKAKEYARKLKFPFERKALEELKNIMIAFRGNVDGVLQLLSLDNVLGLGADAAKHHTAVLGKVQSTGSQVFQTVTTELGQKITASENNLSQKLDFSMTSMTTAISQSAIAMSQSVVAEMSQTILPAQGASVINSITRQIHDSRNSIEGAVFKSRDEVLSAINAQAHATQQISMALVSLVGGHSAAQMLPCSSETSNGTVLILSPSRARKKHSSRAQSLARWTSTACTCVLSTRRVTSTRSYRWIFSKQTESAIHKRNCPLWYQSQVATKYGVQFALLKHLGVFGSLSISGSPGHSTFGWGISQSLALKPIVPDDSPAFKVIKHHFSLWKDEIDVSSCVQDLMAVFQSGQGLPTDTQLDGTTLIQCAFDEMHSRRGDVSALWTLIRELFVYGIKISFNHGHTRKYSRSAWYTLHAQVFARIDPTGDNIASTALAFFTWLIEHDIEIIPPDRYVDSLIFSPFGSDYRVRLVLDALRSQEDLRDAAECGILSTAVLRRDRSATEMILNQHPGLLVTERDVFGHSPIHHAIGWLEGLKLILSVANEATLHQGLVGAERTITLLDSAIAYGCTDSVRLLLDADVAFNLTWSLLVGTDALDADVSNMVVKAIVERLEQLVEFGKRNLPARVFASLNITDSSSLDGNARGLLNALHAEGIQLPQKFHTPHRLLSQDFWLPSGTLYHQSDLGYNTAMAFFKAGLTNVDYMAEKITPLMGLGGPMGHFSRYFRMVEFFVEKGGRLERRIPSKLIQPPVPSTGNAYSYRVIHRASAMAWASVVRHSDDSVFAIAELGLSHIWRGILQSSTSDPCDCACASGGCRPISLALKISVSGMLGSCEMGWGSVFNPQNWKEALELLRKQTYLLDGLEGNQFVEDVIRYLSFSALGLTHTCCHYTLSSYFGFNTSGHQGGPYIKLMDPTEAEEICHEEIRSIERLDCLVDEFMKIYQEREVSLAQFLLNYWQETMLAELSVEDEVPEPVREQWREIGVVIGDIRPPAEEEVDETPQSRHERQDRAYTGWIEGIRRSIGPA